MIAIRLKPVHIAAFYALLAFGNCLLYWQGSPFEVLGFTDDPIGWWAMVTVPFTVAFCLMAVRITQQDRLGHTHPRLQSLRRLTIMLVVLAILFAVPNVLIAFLHVNAIRAGFSYWGQVRAAYEIPFFHLLPVLLLLYWWISSLRKEQAAPTPSKRHFSFIKGRKGLTVACSGEEVLDVMSTLTDWLYAGILFLGGYAVLAFIIVNLSQPQVVHRIDGGISVVTDFTALAIYVISGGALLGLLVAIGVYVYWRRRLHLMVDANPFFAMRAGFICLTLWWLPLVVAMTGAFALAVYLQQNFGLHLWP